MDFPPGYFNNRSDDSEALKALIRSRMQESLITFQLRQSVETAFNETLAKEAVILSRSERQALFNDILRDLLNGMLSDLDTDS